ncbi:MAG TPA: Gldg family protein [Gemmatimonadales bacterium]|nr:Gldg family protein [Gemmatimonadales bacterium]
MKAILTIARRELKALFDNPSGYVLLIVFLVVNAFLFFRQAFLTNSATLRPMLDILPWLYLFFVPAVAMRTLAEDTRSGQLEVVLSQPINELQLLVGKYLGATFFLWIALLLSLPIPLGLSLGAELPWGAVFAQYVGAALLAAGLAGVGVWASGIARSQITAFIVAVAVMFLLVLVGLNPLVVGLPPQLGLIAARLGVLSHFDSIGRGVIDLRDVVYFVSLAAIFLTLAYGALMARKLAAGQGAVRRLRVGVLLLVGILVVVNLLGSYIGGRLDLTPGRAYTLSPATKQLVGSLGDIVTIKVYASDELPAEVGLMKRDLDDLLGDLRSAGKGKIRVIAKDPAKSPDTQREAQNLGIQPVQFNVVGQSSLQVKEGYLGLAIQYADGNEAIPFVRRTDDLEYRIAAAIRGLTRTRKPRIGLIVAMDDWGREGRTLSAVQEQLARSYEVTPVSLNDFTALADTTIRTLIVAGQPDSISFPASQALAAFFERGGSALVMTTGAPIDGVNPRARGKEPVWNAILKPFGVKVRPDLIYDLSSNQLVPVPGGQGVYQPYPFWLRARPGSPSTVTDGVSEVFLPWVSSIDTTGAAPGSVTPLLISSRAGGVAEGDINLDPTRSFPPVDRKTRVVGVSVQAPARDSTAKPGRLVLVGNMEFATDRYLGGAPDNGTFALNAIDWLAQDEALISIRSRDRRPPRLLYSSKVLQEGVKYANLIAVPVFLAVWGLLRLAARRRRSLTPWTPLAGGTAPEAAA